MTNWDVQTLNSAVDEELDRLPDDMKARFVRVAGLLDQFGPKQVGMPHIRSLGNKLWEIRVAGRDGIARGIYVIATQKRIIILHVFIKKSQKTPLGALNIATTRARTARLL